MAEATAEDMGVATEVAVTITEGGKNNGVDLRWAELDASEEGFSAGDPLQKRIPALVRIAAALLGSDCDLSLPG